MVDLVGIFSVNSQTPGRSAVVGGSFSRIFQDLDKTNDVSPGIQIGAFLASPLSLSNAALPCGTLRSSSQCGHRQTDNARRFSYADSLA